MALTIAYYIEVEDPEYTHWNGYTIGFDEEDGFDPIGMAPDAQTEDEARRVFAETAPAMARDMFEGEVRVSELYGKASEEDIRNHATEAAELHNCDVSFDEYSNPTFVARHVNIVVQE